jgi:hypothetical protein
MKFLPAGHKDYLGTNHEDHLGPFLHTLNIRSQIRESFISPQRVYSKVFIIGYV